MARIVYTDMSGQERSVPIGAGAPIVSIGRATDCTIRSNRKSVSRRHAEFRFANGQFEIVDLNSSNGTYLIINEERQPVLGRQYLTHNDEVWCGDFILRFFEEDVADPYGDDSTFNPAPAHAQHATSPPAFGGSGFGGANYGGAASNNQFGGPAQPSTGWNPSPQPGQSFQRQAAPVQNQGFGGAGQGFGGELQFEAGFGNEPSFGNELSFGNEPSFGNERSLGNSPSHANEPPRFGDPNSSAYDDAATRNQRGYEAGILDTSTQNHQDLAVFMQGEDFKRLEQERDSYADLAERQKGEIDDLQARLRETERRLNEAGEELEQLREKESSTAVATPPAEVAKLRDDLAAATAELKDLRARLRHVEDDANSARSELEHARRELDHARAEAAAATEHERELEQLRAQYTTLENDLANALQMAAEPDHEAQAEIADLREQLAGKQRDVTALEGEVDRLTDQLRAAEDAANEQVKSSAQKAREESEALRRELERHKRLVEEFEKRNRELQAELEAAQDGSASVQNLLAEGEAKRADLEAELEALAADLEAARTERDATHAAMEALKAQGNVADLRNEIEGLKHRLKMEKERAGKGDARLTEEIDRLNARVATLEADNGELQSALAAAAQSGGATAADLATLHDKIAALDRIVDAIVRTNLDPLSTVDRIRLQSAIRDTDPKLTLATLLELTSSD